MVAQSNTSNWEKQVEPSYKLLDKNTVFKGLAIYSIFHASNGATYLGSNAGVYRYNNKEFANLHLNFNKKKTTLYFEICEDDSGRLLFGSIKNTITVFDHDTLYPYKYNSTLKAHLPKGRYFHNIQKEGGSLYFSNIKDGVVQIDSNGNWNDSLFPIHSSQDTFCANILGLKRGMVAGLTSTPHAPSWLKIQLRSAAIAPIQTYTIPFNFDPKFIQQKRVYAIRFNGNVLIGLGNKVYQIKGKRMRKIIELDHLINGLTYDHMGQLWVCTKSGVFIYAADAYSQPMHHWFSNHDLIVKGQLEDQEGVAWVISYDKGPMFIPNQQIKRIPIPKGQKNNILNIAKDNNGFLYLLASPEDLIRISPKGDSTFYHYPTDVTQRQGRNKLFFHAPSQTLWLLRTNNTLRIDGEHLTQPLEYPACEELTCTSSGHLIFLYKYFIQEFRNDTLYKSFKRKDALRYSGIESGANDTVWLGSERGLFYYLDGETHPYKTENPLLKGDIVDMVSLTDGTLCLTIDSVEGIAFFSEGHLSVWKAPFSKYTTEQIFYLENNILIIYGKHKYLLSVSPTDTLSYTIPRIDGRPQTSNWLGDCYWNNQYWECGYEGTITMDSSYVFNRPKSISNFGVSRILVNGKRKPLQSSYTLPYDENNFRFIFSFYSTLAYKPSNYWCRIKEIDPNWLQTDAKEVQFTSLDPGSYTFELKAEHIDAEPEDYIYSIPITILPPFYETWWFRTGGALFILGLLYLIYRFQIRRIKAVNALKSMVTKHQQQALSAQMNPHFIFNSMNSVQQFILDNKKEEAFAFLANFGKLIRRVMEQSSYEFIPLEEELDTLGIYLRIEQSRLQQQFDYRIEVDASIDPQEVEIPPLLIQPYVENAIWHGIRTVPQGGKIEVSVTPFQENGILCSIKDNGVGRAKTAAAQPGHQSMGMSKTASRLEILAQSNKEEYHFEIIDRTPATDGSSGTEVRFVIPGRY